MYVICDTNIWYGLGNGSIQSPPNNLVPCYLNLEEFYRSEKVITNLEVLRKAVQSMFRFSYDSTFFLPPYIYIQSLADPNYTFDKKEIQDVLGVTEGIANGLYIEEKNHEFFLHIRNEMIDRLEKTANLYNSTAKILKSKIKDIRHHRTIDKTESNRKFIAKLISKVEHGTGIPLNFRWEYIELFEKTLGAFFIELEVGGTVFKPNDLFDLFMLVYVSPEDKYWTKEKKWKGLIRKAGMEHYLFEK